MGNTLKFLIEYRNYINDIDNSDISSDDYIYNEILKRSHNNRLRISEGLIKTHQSDISIKIIKKRFPELDISIDHDGDIYIYKLNDKISKYLPIITNLGYFISQISHNSINWEHDIITDDLYPEAICIEPKYLDQYKS